MKTFFNLIQEVQKPGLCHRCGGCVTFCTAVNYGALEIDADGKPRYAEIEKCIECGLCHAICPEVSELEDETKRQFAWSEPMGRIIETTVARASDEAIRRNATDGGVVTALLTHLFERGRIDGAIVARQVGPFQRAPYLATTQSEILDSAGFFFDTSHGMKEFSDLYMTYSSIMEFDPLMQKHLSRVAFVGTPCQIKSVRRMQVMGLVPSDAIRFCFGLFCSGNFVFGPAQQAELAKIGGFDWNEVRKINVKESLQVHLTTGQVKTIPLEDMVSMQRYACRFCPDYSAEYADISFGGLGAPEGWTTTIVRTPLGRAALADARSAGKIMDFSRQDNPGFATEALTQVRNRSGKKRVAALHNRRELTDKPVTVRF
jgi:coenzyme F420 hydrogenase subunit beta